jgi:uncharacterized protein YggT (Ycf19 family)
VSALAVVVFATTRHEIARYLNALLFVYLILIFTYVVVNIVFSVGVRPPYARWSNAILTFLRDVVEPYLRIFRRFLPMFGPFDLSPMVATIVLIVGGRLIVSLVNG